jgi:hypothetical protein
VVHRKRISNRLSYRPRAFRQAFHAQIEQMAPGCLCLMVLQARQLRSRANGGGSHLRQERFNGRSSSALSDGCKGWGTKLRITANSPEISPQIPVAAVFSFLEETRGMDTWSTRDLAELLRMTTKKASTATHHVHRVTKYSGRPKHMQMCLEHLVRT